MKYEFYKNLKKVTVIADNCDDVLDIEELRRVVGVVDIAGVDYVTRPLNPFSCPRVVISTARVGGVTDLKFMAMSRTFKPFKMKTATKD